MGPFGHLQHMGGRKEEGGGRGRRRVGRKGLAWRGRKEEEGRGLGAV